MESRFAVPETTLWRGQAPPPHPAPRRARSRESCAARGPCSIRSSVTSAHLSPEEFILRGERGSTFVSTLNTAGYFAGAAVWLTLGGALGVQMRERRKATRRSGMGQGQLWGKPSSKVAHRPRWATCWTSSPAAPQGERRGRRRAGGRPRADLWNLTGGNVLDVAGGLDKGKEVGGGGNAHVGRDAPTCCAVQPSGHHALDRAAWNRAISANIQRLLDPDADEQF